MAPELIGIGFVLTALWLIRCRHEDYVLERRGNPPVLGHTCQACGHWSRLKP